MEAKLVEGKERRPLIRFSDGRMGVPINLRFLSRLDFLAQVGRQVTILSQLSDVHYTVSLPGHNRGL